MNRSITAALDEHSDLIERLRGGFLPAVEEMAALLIRSIRSGQTVFWCGNGGSAADAQHMAAELVGRFARERRAFPSLALTTDTSILTSVGNDYGFDNVFGRQVEALVRKGDVLVAISTSGASRNVIQAVEKANALGATCLGLLGRDGGRLNALCRHAIVVPSSNTARIQEIHVLIGHLLCDLIESACTE